MIYMGEELYLSKFGNSGRLIVGTLEEMKKLFGGNAAFVAKPKNQSKKVAEEGI